MRLNLGAGGQRAPGWTSLDRAGDVDVIHDLTVMPLPFTDDSCEGAVAHHVLDLLGPGALHYLLRDLRRILQPDAVLRISLADLEFGITAAFEHDLGWFPEPRETLDETLSWFLRQGGARRLLLTAARLKTSCYVAGFNEFAIIEDPEGKTLGPPWMTEFDARFHESFFVEAW